MPIVATKSPGFPSAKVPASLSSIYVPTKPSPVLTEYISNIVHIDDIYFNKAMFGQS